MVADPRWELGAVRKAARRAVVSHGSVPAPIGGLNARDSIANMKPTDAIIMDNWVPGTTSVAIRKGYTAHVTGFAAAVETLMVYQATSIPKLFAVSGTGFYDATTPGPVGAAVVTGLSNARWQYVNFGTAGGQFLYAVNGADKARMYDGTNWKIIGDGVGAVISSITHVGNVATVTTATPHGRITGDTITVTGAAPADYNVTAKPITVLTATTFTYTMATVPATNATVVGAYTYSPSIQGVDTALLKDVQVYGRRLWFTEKSSFRVWYLPVDSIAGTAASIDLGPLFILGGSLQGMVVWTVASELGTINYAAFVSSEGELALYAGNNPDSAATWALVGLGRIGKPIGQRFWASVGGDTVLICEDGLQPLSKAMINDRASQSDAISYKITNLINQDISDWKAVFGWQLLLYPLGNKIICNAPKSNDLDNVQYVMNTITNEWCRYVNIPAHCWGLFLDNPYFGTSTAVYKAEYGYNDNGAGIAGDIMPAYSYFQSSGLQKLFTATRPVITANGNFKPRIGLSTDFTARPPNSSPTLSLGTNGSLWDVSPWNTTSWGDSAKTSKDWQWFGGIGFAATIRMQSLTKDMSVEWQATDYVWEASKGGYF